MTKSTETSALPPRPLNCFLLYRIDKQRDILAKCEGANHRDISKIIAKWWKEATDEEKAPYVKKAQEEKRKHAKLYPDYKYSPKKKTEPKRIYRRKTNSNFTSRKEENNKIMERIYEDHTSLKTVKKPMMKHDCARKAAFDKSDDSEIKLEQVESPKLACIATDTAFSDASSPFANDASSFSSSTFPISPVLSWKSSPSTPYSIKSPDVESPLLSFSTRLPLQTFSPVNYSLSGCSTPSAVFSPTSYHIEPSVLHFNNQEQSYASSSCDISLKDVSTPTDLVLNASYFAALSSSVNCEDINMQSFTDHTFNSEYQEDVSSCLSPHFQYQPLYSNTYSFESSYLPQCIDPSFLMK